MRSYEEFLDDLIPITKNESMRREDYYQKYIGTTPRDFYDQLVKLENEEKVKNNVSV